MLRRQAYAKAADGLRETIATAREKWTTPAFFVPPEIDVRAIRAKLNLSQEVFASAFGFTVHQMRLWEQGRSRPPAAVRAYLMIIERDPTRVLELLHEAVSSKFA
jgi:putative transcriptional regulator